MQNYHLVQHMELPQVEIVIFKYLVVLKCYLQRKRYGVILLHIKICHHEMHVQNSATIRRTQKVLKFYYTHTLMKF